MRISKVKPRIDKKFYVFSLALPCTIEKKLLIFFFLKWLKLVYWCKFEKKIVGGQFLVYLWPFWKSHRGSVIFPISQLFSLRSKKQPHFLYVTYFYETANFFMNLLLYLYQSAMTVSGTQWHLLSSDVILIYDFFFYEINQAIPYFTFHSFFIVKNILYKIVTGTVHIKIYIICSSKVLQGF